MNNLKLIHFAIKIIRSSCSVIYGPIIGNKNFLLVHIHFELIIVVVVVIFVYPLLYQISSISLLFGFYCCYWRLEALSAWSKKWMKKKNDCTWSTYLLATFVFICQLNQVILRCEKKKKKTHKFRNIFLQINVKRNPLHFKRNCDLILNANTGGNCNYDKKNYFRKIGINPVEKDFHHFPYVVVVLLILLDGCKY